MTDDEQKVQMLTYALGLAIGALEAVSLQPHDFNKDGVENVLKRLREVAEPSIFFYATSESSGKGGSDGA